MNQSDLEKGINGLNAHDNDSGEVIGLLGSLRRVEAPANFEFGVRARIAAREGSKPQASLLPFLKLAAPLTLLLAVTGLVFFYGTTPTADVPTVAESPRAPQSYAPSSSEIATGTPAAVASGPRIVQPIEPSDPVEAASRKGTAGPVRIANNSSARTGRRGSIDVPLRGGSVDSTLSVANSILPRGFESANPRRSVNANTQSTTEVPVREVLGKFGITAEFVDGVCTVRSVADNSLGLRAGVKSGDVIDAIDGRVIKSDTKLRGDAGGKTFSVRRDGKRINLTIGN